MKNRTIKYIFSLMIFSVILIVGCGGSGSQKVLTQESPEAAVMRIAESWRASGDSPSLVVDADGNFIKQIRQQEGTEQHYQDSQSNQNGKIIKLYDLSGAVFDLQVTNVKKEDKKAVVTCNFIYNGSSSSSESSEQEETQETQETPQTPSNVRAEVSEENHNTSESTSSSGYLIIIFTLEFEDGKWWLSNVEITDKPLAEDQMIYTVHHIKVKYDADGKEISREIEESTQIGNLGETVFAKYNSYDDYVIDDERNSVEGILEGTLEDASLVLKIYYRYVKKASYTIYYYFLDKEDNIVASKTETEIKSGVVGEEVYLEQQDQKTYEDYVMISYDDEKYHNIYSDILKEDGSTKLVFYYRPIKQEEEDEPTPTIYTITGTVKDNSGSIEGATIKVYTAEDTNTPVKETTSNDKGEYTVEVDSTGDYLLVITKDGYESQTKKVSVTEGQQSIKANCIIK